MLKATAARLVREHQDHHNKTDTLYEIVKKKLIDQSQKKKKTKKIEEISR